MSRRRHLGCLNRNNSSGSSEFIHHADIAGSRQGWISLEQNPWAFVDTYRVGIFCNGTTSISISRNYRCTQSTFQHSWLEHLLRLKMHVPCFSCLLWYLGIVFAEWYMTEIEAKVTPDHGLWRRILPSQCCQIVGDDQSYMSVRKCESEERAKELLLVWSKMFYRLDIFSQHGIRPSSFTGLRSAHRFVRLKIFSCTWLRCCVARSGVTWLHFWPEGPLWK